MPRSRPAEALARLAACACQFAAGIAGAGESARDTGMFLAKYARFGDDVFIGGQPTEKALRDLRAQGVGIRLARPDERWLPGHE